MPGHDNPIPISDTADVPAAQKLRSRTTFEDKTTQRPASKKSAEADDANRALPPPANGQQLGNGIEPLPMEQEGLDNDAAEVKDDHTDFFMVGPKTDIGIRFLNRKSPTRHPAS